MLTLGVDAFSDTPFPFALLTHDGAKQGERPPWELIAKNFDGKPGKNVRVNMHAAQILTTDCAGKGWVKAAYQMTSRDAWRHVYMGLFKNAIQRFYPKLEQKVNRRLEDWTVGRRYLDKGCDVYLDFQLSINTPTGDTESTVSKPHVDNPQELIAGLLYMREEGDDAGGDLQVYSCRNPRFEGKADLRSDVDAKVLFTVPYGNANGIMFMQTPYSIHGVTPRKPTNRPRQFISFSAELDFPLFGLPR